jgi:hypothetical protein
MSIVRTQAAAAGTGAGGQLIHVDAEVSLVALHAADYPGPWGPDPAA